eukprot:CAMPEP_0202859928 /NCGR_PEP_ID=MMETSP1391-20130828/1847_1 /ASSEMBLY_ACC=CAM_ASM_000867 /TAXON_ID=1034604 /ORGANISM="Chlamydomonas leiostraca, Strain SAG 11-49" /LENGTH=225 /DNA_ID=CAMNT_0049539035 /DNA_START=129 /DNA_END=803 /DNA_ORIENTATION=+
MGHRQRSHSAALLLVLAAGLCAGVSAWGEDMVSISFSHRRLNAYYEHNFGVAVPTECYRNNYASPYRVYADSIDTSDPGQQGFKFFVNITDCAMASSPCCDKNLEKLVIRTSLTKATIKEVWFESTEAQYTVDDYGVTIELAVTPSMSSTGAGSVVTIFTDKSVSTWRGLCPLGRSGDRCDYIAYSSGASCCQQRVAMIASDFAQNQTDTTAVPPPPPVRPPPPP